MFGTSVGNLAEKRAPRYWLLVTDLDDTLLSEDQQPGDSNAFRLFLDAIDAQPDLLVVVNSSRPRDSVLDTLRSRADRFRPDGLITAMGTEIAFVANGEVDENASAEWTARFGAWSRDVIDDAVAPFTKHGVQPHANEYQGEFKASFFVPIELQPSVYDAIKRLDQPSKIVMSGSSDFDVLPPNAGKGEATRFASEYFRVDPSERLVVAGDSANDIDLFRVCDRGIIVGNARAELREHRDAARAYQSAMPCSAGVLDGLRHWGAIRQQVAENDAASPAVRDV